MNNKNSRSVKKTVLLISLITLALACVIFAVIFIFGFGNISNEDIMYSYTAEAGSEISPNVFVTGDNHVARFAETVDIDTLSKMKTIILSHMNSILVYLENVKGIRVMEEQSIE